MIGNNDCKFFGEETGKKLVEESDRFVIEQGQTLEKEEINFIPHLNEYHHYLTVKKPLYDSAYKIYGLFGISTDITELKKIQQDLYKSEQKLTTILDNVGAYIYIKDSNHRFQYINKVTEELFQRTSDEVIGLNNFELLGPAQGEEFDRTDREVFATGKEVTCIEVLEADSDPFYFLSVKVPLANDQGVIDSYIGISTDITEQKRFEKEIRNANKELNRNIEELTMLEEKLLHQATHDALTGLYNRRFIEEHASLVFTDSTRSETSVLMIDVDHFKEINDTLGHKIGDEILQFLGQVMSHECRANDLVCRYGGDEFLILLPETLADTAFEKAEQIRKQYEEAVVKRFSDVKGSSISVGVATSPHNGNTFDSICQAADQALYQAKESGRGCSATPPP